MRPNASRGYMLQTMARDRAIYLILRAFLEESRGRHPLLVLTVPKFHDYSTADHLLVLVSSADLYTVIV